MKYERIRYPDGQISAKYDPLDTSGNPFDEDTIRERINSYEDLMYVRSIADVLHRRDIGDMPGLFIPCLFGQRSDRRFHPFQSFDLKMITNIINDCRFSTVKILDPHSDVALALIDRSEKVSPDLYVSKALLSIMAKEGNGEIILVSPDAGAYKKVFEMGKGFNHPVVGAVKHRDGDGNVELKFMGDVEGKVCLIVDDLCDGGYTFEVLSKALRAEGAAEVYLYVTHGYFSKGFIKLAENIKHIYCTNSVKDLESNQNTHPDIKDPRWITDYLTQYKVI